MFTPNQERGGAVTPIFARLPRYIDIPEKEVPSLSITAIMGGGLRGDGRPLLAPFTQLYVVVGMRDFS